MMSAGDQQPARGDKASQAKPGQEQCPTPGAYPTWAVAGCLPVLILLSHLHVGGQQRSTN